MESTDNDSDKEKFSITGKIASTPCLRDSLLYGISGGLALGLTHFLLTSNVKRATNMAFGGYIGMLFTTWVYCRYNRAKQHNIVEKWQKTLQEELSGNVKYLDPKDV